MTGEVYPYNFDPSTLENDSERLILRLLAEQLPDGSRIYPAVDGYIPYQRAEIDFVVCIPNEGVALIEVKSGLTSSGGSWTQFSRKTRKREKINITEQIDNERRLFKRLIDGYFDGHRSPRFVPFLVLPDFSPDPRERLPGDLLNEQYIFKSKLSYLAKTIVDYLHSHRGGTPFNYFEMQQVHEAIVGRGDTYVDYVRTTTRRGETIENLTVEQSFVLDMLTLNPRLYIQGGPGTGKTVLAVEMVKRLYLQGKKVGFVCYNQGLAREVRGRLEDSDVEIEFIGVVKQDLAEYLGVKLPKLPNSKSGIDDYWIRRVPKLIRKATRFLKREKRFDAWVVDEAQDLSTVELENLRKLLKDKNHGEIYLFGDPYQDLFSVESKVPWPVTYARLLFNVRCAPAIANLLNAIVPETQTIFFGDPRTRKPSYIYAPNLEEIDRGITEAVDNLKGNDWYERHMCVVATGERLPQHQELRERLQTDERYWDEFFSQESIFYTRLMAFKGLERPVVVLVFNKDYETSEEILKDLFIGAGRARDELLLVLTENNYNLLSSVHNYIVDYRISS